MKENPILFSAPMVQAIQAGRKTQTRRMIHLPSNILGGDLSKAWPNEGLGAPGEQYLSVPMPDETVQRLFCPYGHPGDGLWVKETWKAHETAVEISGEFQSVEYLVEYRAGGNQKCFTLEGHRSDFAADGVFAQYTKICRSPKKGWRPSIFMPRWASRFDLLITKVRAQELFEITVADCFEEGISVEEHGYDPTDPAGSAQRVLGAYRTLWTSINGPEAWDQNPRVWAIDFERVL